MTVPNETSDENILVMLDKMKADTGAVPGRNAIMREAGIGAGRATRLRQHWSVARGVTLPETKDIGGSDTPVLLGTYRAPVRSTATNGNGGGPDQADQTVPFARIGPLEVDRTETGPRNGHATELVHPDRTGTEVATRTGSDQTAIVPETEPGPVRVEADRTERTGPVQGQPDRATQTVSAWVAKSVPATLTYVSRFGWVVVLLAAFGISWWSLFELAKGYGMPVILAAVVSLVFDGAALIVAHLSHQYALSQDSGAGPRVVLIGVLAGSVFLNWKHAQAMGFGLPASIMFAAPAAVAILLFELQTGWDSRQARRANGRVSDPLPVIGRWGWIFHPVQSLGTVWQVSSARGKHIRRAELDKWERP
jgi:hypothetical protein